MPPLFPLSLPLSRPAPFPPALLLSLCLCLCTCPFPPSLAASGLLCCCPVSSYLKSFLQLKYEGRETRTPNLLIWSQTRYRCAIPPCSASSHQKLPPFWFVLSETVGSIGKRGAVASSRAPLQHKLIMPNAPLHEVTGVWRNGSASDSRSEGWEFESLCPHFSQSVGFLCQSLCASLLISLYLTLWPNG